MDITAREAVKVGNDISGGLPQVTTGHDEGRRTLDQCEVRERKKRGALPTRTKANYLNYQEKTVGDLVAGNG